MAEYRDEITFRVKLDTRGMHREAQAAANRANAQQKARAATGSPAAPSPATQAASASPAAQPVNVSQVARAGLSMLHMQRMLGIGHMIPAHGPVGIALHMLAGTGGGHGGGYAHILNAFTGGGGRGIVPRVTAAGDAGGGGGAAGGGAAAAAGGAGRGIAGLLGGAGAGALLGAGAIAALVIASTKNAVQASMNGLKAQNRIGAGAFNADPSQTMKGVVNYNAAVLRFAGGPFLGPVFEKIANAGTKVIDIFDKLADTGKRYNGQIAASAAELNVHTIRAQMRIANAMAPMLSQWNKFKTQVVDLGSKFAALGGRLLSGILTPIEKAATAMLRAVNWLLDKLGLGGTTSTASQMGNFLNHANPAANLRNRGAIGGRLANLIGSTSGQGTLRQSQTDIDNLMRQQQADLQIVGNPKFSQAEQEAAAKRVQDADKKIAALRKRLASQPANGMPANQSSPGTPSQRGSLPQLPPPSTGAPPRLPSVNESPAFNPMGTLDINQRVNFQMQMTLAHEQRIHDAISQIRNWLMQKYSTANDEARLALSMLNLGGGLI